MGGSPQPPAQTHEGMGLLAPWQLGHGSEAWTGMWEASTAERFCQWRWGGQQHHHDHPVPVGEHSRGSVSCLPTGIVFLSLKLFILKEVQMHSKGQIVERSWDPSPLRLRYT